MPRAFLTARCKTKDDQHDDWDEDEHEDESSNEAAEPFLPDLPPDVAQSSDTGHNTRAAKRRKQNLRLQLQKQLLQKREQERLNPPPGGVVVEPEKPPPPVEHWIVDAEGKQRHMYECPVCSKFFPAMYILQRHLPTHTGERKFECPICGRRFSQASTLSRHKATHTNLRPFQCEVCNKAFNRQSTLISHTKLHSEIRPHKCNICGRAFHQKGNLKTHMNTHLDSRPYKCQHCDRGFNQQSNLVFHVAQAHTDRNQVSCHLCGDMFRKKHDLRKHELKVHGVSNKAELDAWQRKKASGALYPHSTTTTSNTITLPNGDKTIKFDTKRLGLANAVPEVTNPSEDKGKIGLSQNPSVSNTITLPNGDKTIKFDARRFGAQRACKESNKSQEKAGEMNSGQERKNPQQESLESDPFHMTFDPSQQSSASNSSMSHQNSHAAQSTPQAMAAPSGGHMSETQHVTQSASADSGISSPPQAGYSAGQNNSDSRISSQPLAGRSMCLSSPKVLTPSQLREACHKVANDQSISSASSISQSCQETPAVNMVNDAGKGYMPERGKDSRMRTPTCIRAEEMPTPEGSQMMSTSFGNNRHTNVGPPLPPGGSSTAPAVARDIPDKNLTCISTSHAPMIGRPIATFLKVQASSSSVLQNNFQLNPSQIKTVGTDSSGPMIAMISQAGGGTPLLLKMVPLSASLLSSSAKSDKTDTTGST